MSSYQYRKSHCGDKTVVRSSYLHNGISYTGKMTFFCWIGAQGSVLITGVRRDKGVDIRIDTNIEVNMASLTIGGAHHSLTTPEGAFRGLSWVSQVVNKATVTKLRYQLLFYHGEINYWWINKCCQGKCLKLSQTVLVTAWLHVHSLGSGDLIVSPW